jgi:hypothetical protein
MHSMSVMGAWRTVSDDDDHGDISIGHMYVQCKLAVLIRLNPNIRTVNLLDFLSRWKSLAATA